jgi:hypothetical protein
MSKQIKATLKNNCSSFPPIELTFPDSKNAIKQDKFQRKKGIVTLSDLPKQPEQTGLTVPVYAKSMGGRHKTRKNLNKYKKTRKNIKINKKNNKNNKINKMKRTRKIYKKTRKH